MFSKRCAAQVAFMLPGVPPTHKKVSIPLIVVVNFEDDKVCSCPWVIEDTSWVRFLHVILWKDRQRRPWKAH